MRCPRLRPSVEAMKKALITGASRGLGRALADGLAAAGYSLVIDARDAGALNAAAAAIRCGAGRRGHRGAGRRHGPGAPVRAPRGRRPARPAGEQRQHARRGAAARAGRLPARRAARRVRDERARTGRAGPAVPARSACASAAARYSTSLRTRRSSSTQAGAGTARRRAALEQASNVLAAEEVPAIRVWWVDPGDLRTDMHQAAFPGQDISGPAAAIDNVARPRAARGRAVAERPLRCPPSWCAGMTATVDFALPAELEAQGPPEVARPAALTGSGCWSAAPPAGRSPITASLTCPGLLLPGDLIVVNTSRTMLRRLVFVGKPGLTVHFGTALPDGTWLIEPRIPQGKSTIPNDLVSPPTGSSRCPAARNSSSSAAPRPAMPARSSRSRRTAVSTAVRQADQGTRTRRGHGRSRRTRRSAGASMPAPRCRQCRRRPRSSPEVVSRTRHARGDDRPDHAALRCFLTGGGRGPVPGAVRRAIGHRAAWST